MGGKRYSEAEEVLNKAEKYLQLSYEQQLELIVQRVLMCLEIADADKENRVEHLKKAKMFLDKALKNTQLNVTNRRELRLIEAELYLRGGFYAEAGKCAELLANERQMKEVPAVGTVEQKVQDVNSDRQFWSSVKKSDEQDEEYMQFANKLQAVRTPQQIQKVLDNPDLVSERLAQGAANTGTADIERIKAVIEQMASEPEDAYRIMPAEQFRDRLNNVLISCYIEADQYESVPQYARVLKESSNARFANFGYYAEAMSTKKLADQGKADAAAEEALYNKAVAHYKKRMFEDPSDISAVVYRGRLYAEHGKFALAEQMAKMLRNDDMESLNEYIASCRQGT